VADGNLVLERRAAAAAPARPRRPTPKRRAFDLHSWFGFQLCALFALVLVTGTLATVSNEIDWLASADFRVTPRQERASWEEMKQSVRRAAPDQGIWWIALGPGSRYAATAVTVDAAEFRRNVRVDPHSGAVTGSDPWLNAQRFLRDLHRYLFMPSVIGLPIVSAFAVLLLYQLYSGLRTVTGWRKAATRLRTDRGLRVAIGDLHKSAGIWVSWFLVLIAVTGIWYLAELVMERTGVESETPYQSMPAGWVERQGPVIPYRPLDAYVAAAEAAFPALEPRTLRLPFGPDEPVVVEGPAGDPLARDRANEVWLDPVDARVVAIQRSADMTPLHYVTEIADPLHFGTLGGLPTKLIWFAMGLGLSGLALTGAWLAWRRLRRTAPTPVQWLTLAPLAAVVLLGWHYVRDLSTPDGFARRTALPVQMRDGFRLRPELELSPGGAPSGRLRIGIATDLGGLNFAGATVAACGADAAGRIGYAGWAAKVAARLPPAALAGCDRLQLELVYHDGTRRRLAWALR
jgi:uncharacterized iron-regulated membrane protein